MRCAIQRAACRLKPDVYERRKLCWKLTSHTTCSASQQRPSALHSVQHAYLDIDANNSCFSGRAPGARLAEARRALPGLHQGLPHALTAVMDVHQQLQAGQTAELCPIALHLTLCQQVADCCFQDRQILIVSVIADEQGQLVKRGLDHQLGRC